MFHVNHRMIHASINGFEHAEFNEDVAGYIASRVLERIPETPQQPLHYDEPSPSL